MAPTCNKQMTFFTMSKPVQCRWGAEHSTIFIQRAILQMKSNLQMRSKFADEAKLVQMGVKHSTWYLYATFADESNFADECM